MEFQEVEPSQRYLIDLRGQALSVALVLLTFIFSVFLACALFRLACSWGRGSVVAATGATGPTMIGQHAIAIPAAAPVAVGLDATTIKSLPMFTHRSSVYIDTSINHNNFKRSECCICLGLYEDEDVLKVMPDCLHIFHSDCVDEWLRSRSTCPLCRSSLDSSTAEPVVP
nr:E3 ubiquitin-protein ligase ATL9-like [Coffea arabica]